MISIKDSFLPWCYTQFIEKTIIPIHLEGGHYEKYNR